VATFQKDVKYLGHIVSPERIAPNTRSWKPYGNGRPQRINTELEASCAYARITDGLFPVSPTLRNRRLNSWRSKASSGLQKWRLPSKHYSRQSVLLLILLTRRQERGSSLTQKRVTSGLEECCPKCRKDGSEW
jgi:hypothetical protein